MTEDQFSAYRTAKSTRPSWANALIVAALLFLGGIAAVVFSAMTGAWMLFAASGIALVVAGIYALVGATRRAP